MAVCVLSNYRMFSIFIFKILLTVLYATMLNHQLLVISSVKYFSESKSTHIVFRFFSGIWWKCATCRRYTVKYDNSDQVLHSFLYRSVVVYSVIYGLPRKEEGQLHTLAPLLSPVVGLVCGAISLAYVYYPRQTCIHGHLIHRKFAHCPVYFHAPTIHTAIDNPMSAGQIMKASRNIISS